MKLLLDTCTFLWLITSSPKLSKKAAKSFLNPKNEAFLSLVSVWEIVIKYQLGRLPLPESPEALIPRECQVHDIELLPLTQEDIFELLRLKSLHDDPFDRLLVCQATVNDMTILTPDREITDYPVKSAW